MGDCPFFTSNKYRDRGNLEIYTSKGKVKRETHIPNTFIVNQNNNNININHRNHEANYFNKNPNEDKYKYKIFSNNKYQKYNYGNNIKTNSRNGNGEINPKSFLPKIDKNPIKIIANNENMKNNIKNSSIKDTVYKEQKYILKTNSSKNSNNISNNKQSYNIQQYRDYENNKTTKDKQNKKKNDISYDKESVSSKRTNKRKQSCDSQISKISNNYYNNVDTNNKKNLEEENNKKEKIDRNKHVSVNKYKQKEKIIETQKKYQIECIDKPISQSLSFTIKPKGLYNLGLSCYMNSLLQCLYYIPEFREYFIKEKNNFKNNQPICKALSEVMFGLKYENKEYFEPILFKKEMGNKNSLFSGVKAGDAKDLYFNLIDGIISETAVEIENQSINEDYDPTNKLSVFKETYNEIDNKNTINDLLLGYYDITYKCKNNPNIKLYSFSTDAFILFNLEKISKYWQNNQLKIEDCFEYNYNRRYDTSFYCSKCDKTEMNTAFDTIYKPPKILVVILDRGKGKSFKGNVTFDFDLDLKNFIDEENYQASSKYTLISVSTHSGTSSSSGHYTACCLTDNDKYYYFSDTYVQPVHNKNKIFENEPYLLFYRRNNWNQ